MSSRRTDTSPLLASPLHAHLHLTASLSPTLTASPTLARCSSRYSDVKWASRWDVYLYATDEQVPHAGS